MHPKGDQKDQRIKEIKESKKKEKREARYSQASDWLDKAVSVALRQRGISKTSLSFGIFKSSDLPCQPNILYHSDQLDGGFVDDEKIRASSKKSAG